MAWVGRKYKLEKSENFGDYMKALGEKHFSFYCTHGVHIRLFFCLKNTPSHTIYALHATCKHRLFIYFFCYKWIWNVIFSSDLKFCGFSAFFFFSYLNNTYIFSCEFSHIYSTTVPIFRSWYSTDTSKTASR